MKKFILLSIVSSILFTSCKKEVFWDMPLNGTWVEVTNNNPKALPSNCTIEFADGVMVICDESIGANLNHDSKIFANNGQVWISYKLSFRKHEEYRYDYQFEGEYLWIMEETTKAFTPVINHSKAKKYRRK
jgi:hypothetical protein